MMGENIQKFTPKPVEEILQNNNNSFNKPNINYNNIQKVETNTENIDLNSYLPNKEDIKQATDILGDLVKSTAAGSVVSKAKMTAGLYDIIEHVVDGVIWTGGKVVEGVTYALGSSNNEEYNKKILSWREKEKQFVKDVIAEDVVGHIEDAVFNTQIGKKINDASYMKYDSKQANTIENTTKIGGEIAAATAATIATGGAASPTLLAVTGSIGFAEGAGIQAQKTYQQNKNTTAAKEAGILFSGLAKGTQWFAYGRMGQAVINSANVASEITINQGKWGADSSKTVKEAISTLWNTQRRRKQGDMITKATIKATRDFVDRVDVANGIFETLATSLNDGNMSAKETGTKIVKGVVKDVAINSVINRGMLFTNSLRTPTDKNLDNKIITLARELLETVDSTEDSGLIDMIKEKIEKGINENERNKTIIANR